MQNAPQNRYFCPDVAYDQADASGSGTDGSTGDDREDRGHD
jgi:hypothetical protein